jgi:CheY-like chemotaxis protein
MESVGRLACGVGHDFNNMLTVILGYAAVALEKTKHDSALRGYLEEINKAGQHSADLTRQLLAFARKQMVSPKVLDLNDVVAGMLKMLQRLIGEPVNLTLRPGYDLWRVRIDPSQVDQILANLVINARDAIIGSGNIVITTENVILNDDHSNDQPESRAGKYVLLEVKDDGVGMDASTLEHVFEPFYTTKEPGKGTGLGLSTVYGIVAQNSGFIDIRSETGKGATVRIYLPEYEGTDDKVPEETVRSESQQENATVLLVEDSKEILEAGRTMLDALGYTVLTAATPSEAIHVAKTYEGIINVLMTDIIMPEMNGWDLEERVCLLRPGIKSLFMSGYAADITDPVNMRCDKVFMQKPFSLKELTEKLHQALKS